MSKLFAEQDFFVKIFGDRVFLVGGSVRDWVMAGHLHPHRDIDLVVTGTDYEEIETKLQPYGKSNTVGKSFAVIKFTYAGKSFDISVPRRDARESDQAHSHRNFAIESGAHISLEEDLSRRDFTCNSIAVRLEDETFIDPFFGLDAIRMRQIRMTNFEHFAEDPLRVLRAARFASVLGFSVDLAIYPHAASVPLNELSAERICEELVRLLLESPQPAQGMAEYFRLTVLEKLFPELARLTLTIQDAQFHPEIDEQGHHTVWAHTLFALDAAARLGKQYELSEEQRLTLLLGTLLHDIGKPGTTRWEYKRGRMTITSIYHDTQGVALADGLLERLKVETRRGFRVRYFVLKLIQNHHRIYDLYRNKESVSFKAMARLIKDMEGEEFLLILMDLADRMSREKIAPLTLETDPISSWFLAKQNEFQISQKTIQPLLLGRDLLALGVEPGRKMGLFLKALYEQQLEGIFKSKAEGIRLLKQWLAEGKKL